jgi:hypothetical protein
VPLGIDRPSSAIWHRCSNNSLAVEHYSPKRCDATASWPDSWSLAVDAPPGAALLRRDSRTLAVVRLQLSSVSGSCETRL